MTIINRTHRFIFIHVPKTGGTSVKEHLRNWCREVDIDFDRAREPERTGLFNGIKIKKHSTAVQVRRAIGAGEFERFFKFCVVRNPFVRAMSLFRFLKFSFRSWPNSGVMENIDTLEEFVAAPIFKTAGPGGIIQPQVNWVGDRSGKSYVDFIARVERIEADLHEIKCRIGLSGPDTPLNTRNVSRGDAKIIAAELNSGTVVDAIRMRYAVDFAFLHYSTEPGNAVDPEATSIG